MILKAQSRGRVNQRLAVLETIAEDGRRRRAEAERAADAEGKAFRKVLMFLRLVQVEREHNESFVETVCRAIGITSDEFRGQLRAGIDPMHEHLQKTGILDEMRRILAEQEST
jgi:hypothetical protein